MGTNRVVTGVMPLRRLCSWTLQEPEIERREYQDDSDVDYQPLPDVVPEEQDVRADHDGYQRDHVKHDDCASSHYFVLLCATEWSKSGAGCAADPRAVYPQRRQGQPPAGPGAWPGATSGLRHPARLDTCRYRNMMAVTRSSAIPWWISQPVERGRDNQWLPPSRKA